MDGLKCEILGKGEKGKGVHRKSGMEKSCRR